VDAANDAEILLVILTNRADAALREVK